MTNNAKCFANVPLQIPEQGELIVRGEALITYEDFERINASLPEGEEPYKNPRNLCSGSVRQLDPEETRRRCVRFLPFALAKSEHWFVTRTEQLSYLSSLGFEVVEHVSFYGDVSVYVEAFRSRMSENAFPSDGLVLQYDDIVYGEALGTTSKYPKDSIAFEWADEEKETVLQNIEWSASRTGLINPIAVFEPVELEGTTVRRASVHNVSVLKQLGLSVGGKILVYKANMIIPQISKNLTKGGAVHIPEVCPICGGKTEVRTSIEGAQTLWCGNKACGAKHIGAFVHAVSRDALNIEGLSEETLTKFVRLRFLSTLPDLFRLERCRSAIVWLEGFGVKSYEKLIASVEQARHTELSRLLYALGIPNVGRTASKAICKYFGYQADRLLQVTEEELRSIPDIGLVISHSYVTWFQDSWNRELFEELLAEVVLEAPRVAAEAPLAGMTFVVTGSLQYFPNRKALQARIEELGGRVSGSVTLKTTCLINNDVFSNSGKNKKAKELQVEIFTEAEFLTRFSVPV